MHDKNKDTKCFTELGKYLFKWLFFLTVLPRAVFELNQKSMVELFCKNSDQLLAVNFCKKAPS